VQLNHASPSFNDRLTRGGPLTRTPSSNGARLDVGSDPRKRYTVAGQINRTVDRAGLSQTIYSLDLGVKPADNVEIQVGPDLTRLRQPAQYVSTITDPTASRTFGRRYVFAPLEQTTLAIDTRLNVTFSPRLTLELYAQPFASSNDFGGLKELLRRAASTSTATASTPARSRRTTPARPRSIPTAPVRRRRSG
jgi:hypothetical protein